MRLRSTLAGTAVLATLLGVGMAPAGPMITAAHAQAAISINVFYDGLAQYGEWVSYEDRYVFVPADVRAGWRPYTLGHWVNTDRFGWTWVSDEPFGWATRLAAWRQKPASRSSSTTDVRQHSPHCGRPTQSARSSHCHSWHMAASSVLRPSRLIASASSGPASSQRYNPSATWLRCIWCTRMSVRG